jgi:hypothetical protein
MGVYNCQLLDHEFAISPKNVKSITKRYIADWWDSWENLPSFISAICTTAAAPPTVRKRGTLETERGTSTLPFYCCRCSEQIQTCPRMTSSFVPRLCGGRRCSISDRRHSKWFPVACGGWMSKILRGVAGMLWFRACRVANHTNQNIQHTQIRKCKQLPNANRACNFCRGCKQLLRVL